MAHNSSTHIYLSPQDPIKKLGLTARPSNALRRASIRTIGELAQIIESGHLQDIRNIGEKSAAEIEERLSRVRFVDDPELGNEPDILSSDAGLTTASAQVTQIVEVPVIPIEVIKWQAKLVKKQVSVGLLHEKAKIAGNTIAYWLSAIEAIDRDGSYEILASVLGASISICEELSFLFDCIPFDYTRYITVLLARHGFETKTLEEVGLDLGVTRERVRQISNKLHEVLRRVVGAVFRSKSVSVSDLVASPSLLRMQSALLLAGDMGMRITYEQWERNIRSSGLVGNWASKAYITLDPIEAMIAVCNLLADDNIRELRVPNNLKYAIELATSGTPDLPARIVQVRKTLPRETRRLIRRHAWHSGGVHARWLSQEIGEDLGQVRDMLQALGYRALSRNWFVSSALAENREVSRHDVFHRALKKMLQFCERLSIDDICAGIRCAISRTNFPVPPPKVVGQIMQMCGYNKSEQGLYYWVGEIDQNLSAGEVIIMDCLAQRGPVVHHAELAQAFLDSELSFPSLHATLRRSTLFERIGTGLYKLRGGSVTRQDIERAEAVSEPTSVDLEIRYDKEGSITICATLGILAVCTGTICSGQVPNLSGEWNCFVCGKRCGKLEATESEFRRLGKPFELLGCQTGDRMKFTFNTWDRTVTIEEVSE
jgi:hypothetical protein